MGRFQIKYLNRIEIKSLHILRNSAKFKMLRWFTDDSTHKIDLGNFAVAKV